MRGAVKRCGQVVVAMVAAGAMSVSTGGVLAAAAAPPSAPPGASTAKAPAEDKGPGPKGPRGAPYEKQTAKVEAAAKLKQSGPVKGAKKVEVEAKRTASTRTLQDPITGLLTTELFGASVHYRLFRLARDVGR